MPFLPQPKRFVESVVDNSARSRSLSSMPNSIQTAVAACDRSLQMKVAETMSEREAAFRLVHQVYQKSGLTSENQMGMRIIRHHLLDTTDVMVACRQREVEFSVTLVRDGSLGLPCEALFADEVRSLRESGLRLAEVSCVASAYGDADRKEGFDTYVKMIALTIQTARRRGIDRLLLAVHPRHAKFYQRMFGCDACSDTRSYDVVEGNPAILCSHDFAHLDIAGYRLSNQIYGCRFEPWQMDGTRMSDNEKSYFRNALDDCSSLCMPMAA